MARLLVVGCAREEELPPHHPLRTFLLHLRTTTGVTEIPLQPLDAAETGKLAGAVANRELDMGSVMHLFQETGGYPLFVVEMVRADLGRVSAGPPEADRPHRQPPLEDARTLPPRVHAVLVGRLLQLSASARELVELAAIIGREFTLDFLIGGGLADTDSAVRALDELWYKRIVREHGANGYDFTHDKLREVAYGEISAPQRRMLHRRVAQALEARHAEDLDSVSGQLASHYERAGMIEQALLYYRRAAAVAQCVYANEDAINLLLRSLDGKAGRAEEGLACINEALTKARAHNERWWDAELHRLRGELLLMDGADASEVEAALLRAIAVSQSQQARSLELRATMSLARLWSTRKRFDDARRQLSDVYAWFTEGFETPDLQAARLLLAQL